MSNKILDLVSSVFRRSTPAAAKTTSSPATLSVTGYEVVSGSRGALGVSTAYRSASLISETIARLPLRYLRKNTVTQTFGPHTSDPLYHLLDLNPNARQTSFVMIQNLVQQVLLHGNAYIFPRRDNQGRVAELQLLSPYSVSYDMFSDRYTISDPLAGVSGTYESREVLHFKGRSLDGGYTGVSVIHFAAQTLSIAATADRETRDRFATGGKYKMLLHQEDDGMRGFSAGLNDEEEVDKLADDIEEKLNSGRSIIKVPGTGKLSPLSMSSTDLQFLESRKFTVAEVARFFGVPLAKLMVEGGAGNYKSAGMVNADFYGDTLAPLMTMIEKEFNAKLIEDSIRGSYKIAFDVSALYAADPETRTAYEAKSLANGTATVNELRRANDRPPVEGGDRPLVSANLAPLDTLGGQTSKTKPDENEP